MRAKCFDSGLPGIPMRGRDQQTIDYRKKNSSFNIALEVALGGWRLWPLTRPEWLRGRDGIPQGSIFGADAGSKLRPKDGS